MEMAVTKYKVHECSQCPGDTKFTCISCQCDMCSQCKENHLKDLKTIDHNIVIYRDKFNSNLNLEKCPKHTESKKYWDLYEHPVSCHCTEHKKHTLLYSRDETEQGDQRRMIQIIRNEVLLSRQVLMTTIKKDHNTCHKTFTFYQLERLKKTQRLKDRLYSGFCGYDFKHRCLKQRRKLYKYLYSTKKYEDRYEQSAKHPVQFLREKSHIPDIFDSPHLTIHTNHHSIINTIKKNGVLESLIDIKMRDGKKRHLKNESLLKLMSGVELHQSLSVKDVKHCDHISIVTSDRVWVSYRDNLMLINTKGDTLYSLNKLLNYSDGFHTMNKENELIFIGKGYITKLSKDMKTATSFIETKDSVWRPRCVYCSPSTGDLLVSGYRYLEEKEIGKVTRYNQSGKLTQTICTDNTGNYLYKSPYYITENNNGEVVVSDYSLISKSGAVVVTDRGGRHRFSYTGHPPESGLIPYGICTDALSHILVCDGKANTVQMIDRDGQFLSYLLIRPPGIMYPHSLSYDANTHRFWVGSQQYSTICVYRFITRQEGLTGIFNEIEGLKDIQTSETENPQKRKDNLLELGSPKKLSISPEVTGVFSCHHISCMTSDRAWVHDKNSIILTNKAGETLYHLEDLCDDSYSGLHAVNSEDELLYIDEDYNIKKLSKDMKSAILFIETTASIRIPQCHIWMPTSLDKDAKLQNVKLPFSAMDQTSTWRPRCVCSSPFTRDLLVGMYMEEPNRGKVTRYNQSGELAQTIQYNDNELELYRGPRFITENNNGDVVVCDDDALVVTDREGRHRFSYTGHPLGSGLLPGGICTDALSHIFVCDSISKTVHMIDKDGQFLLHLMEPQEEDEPCSLGYDVHTQSLWVGTLYNNTLSIYTYSAQVSLKDERPNSPGGDVLLGAGSA